MIEKRAHAPVVERTPPSHERLENDVDSDPVRCELVALDKVVKEPEELAHTSAVPWKWTDKNTVQKRVTKDRPSFRVHLARNPIKSDLCGMNSPTTDQTLKSSVELWATALCALE